tara:strand:- start:6082 stop:8433 length:2352 start_codon:yes stop_codon:yes gene_type:complete
MVMTKKITKIIKIIVLIAILLTASIIMIGRGWLGNHEGPGTITNNQIPKQTIENRTKTQKISSIKIGKNEPKQILFGDLHVHTTYSFDAFLTSLPMLNGEGSHPIGDACDFARFCSAIDFWSINDHAEASTPLRWKETVQSIQQCNAVSSEENNPDTVAFLGWEWTQVGRTPDTHYGHKNVIFRDITDDKIPARPIHSGGLALTALKGLPRTNAVQLFALDPNQRMLDFATYLEELRQTSECEKGKSVRDLPSECREGAETPTELFSKLDDWGFTSMVIPHGTTWGFYTPPGSTFEKQLSGKMHDENRQTLIEVFSGHGNSEEYRDFRAAEINESGQPVCSEPTNIYLPSCYRAGEIIRQRCLESDNSIAECDVRAATARQDYVNAGVAGHLAIRGETPSEWLDSGQCKNCYIPAFNYRPGGSAQYILALTNFEEPTNPRRFRFGFMASSDNHRAKPGTGYKEFYRQGMTESSAGAANKRAEMAFRFDDGEPLAFSDTVDLGQLTQQTDINLIETSSANRRLDISGFMTLERERQASFFTTGGLIAVHADGRNRNEIWEAMENKEVYGTSGERILLWFDLLNGDDDKKLTMGSETKMSKAPEFEVRAIGAFEQKAGCPDYTYNTLSPEKLENLCRGECYNPSDKRKLITRIEVIKITPQITPNEDIINLIQDPWRSFDCPLDPNGCKISFQDDEYTSHKRDAVYYVRAIEEPSLAINADNLGCDYDENGNCIKVNMCYGDWKTDPSEDCLSMNEERAWSSPIFVDWKSNENFIATNNPDFSKK